MTEAKGFLRILAFSALAAFGGGASLAQETGAGASSIPATETPWQVNCAPAGSAGEAAGDLSCSMTKNLVSTENGQSRVLVQSTLLQLPDGTVSMRVLVPHGMSLAEGLTLTVDGSSAQNAAFTTSLPAGVVASFVPPAEFIEAMRRGSTLAAEATQNNGRSFGFSLALSGFAASLDKLR